MSEKQAGGQNKPKVFWTLALAAVLLGAAIAIGAGNLHRRTGSFPGRNYCVGCYWDNRYDAYNVSLEGGEFVIENVRTKAVHKTKQVVFSQRDDEVDDGWGRRVAVTLLPEKGRFLLEPEVSQDSQRTTWRLLKPEEATQFAALSSDGQKSHEVVVEYRELAGR
ncbi:MAG: hypothetical protein ABJF10_05020 [Chthoniobacter sp.]|uniref:hypothetical protein n=1 Tax=Chthoniobacter sp. TaxID=2510640 RepID=UPI0032A2154E